MTMSVAQHRPMPTAELERRGRVLLELRTATVIWHRMRIALDMARRYAVQYPCEMTERAVAESAKAENITWDLMAEHAVSAGVCLWPDCELDSPATTFCPRHAEQVVEARHRKVLR